MAKVAFKQREIQAMIRAAKAEGYDAPAVDKFPDGSLRLLTVPPAAAVASASGEADLDAELEAWRASNGDG